MSTFPKENQQNLLHRATDPHEAWFGEQRVPEGVSIRKVKKAETESGCKKESGAVRVGGG